MVQSERDIVKRTFTGDDLGRFTVASVRPNDAEQSNTLMFIPDEAVLGYEWGKLVRTLALQSQREVQVLDAGESVNEHADVMLVGRAAAGIAPETTGRIILLAPSAGEIALSSVSTLLLPEIDEDGRNAFWRERLETSDAGAPDIVTLAGVGTRVEWAWGQVIEAVRGR